MRAILATALLLAACDANAPQGSAYAVSVTTDGGVTLSLPKGYFDVREPLPITWGGLPGNSDDTIVIARRGSLRTERVYSFTTMGLQSYTYRLPFFLPKGEYVLRAFGHIYADVPSVWNNQMLAELPEPFAICDCNFDW